MPFSSMRSHIRKSVPLTSPQFRSSNHGKSIIPNTSLSNKTHPNPMRSTCSTPDP